MSWKDPDSPWVRAMKRKYWYRTRLSHTVLFWFLIAIGLWILVSMSISMGLTIGDALVWMAIVFTAGWVISYIYKETFNPESTHPTLWQFVPEHGGRVCPHCRKTLTAETNKCLVCKTTYDLPLLKTYWMQTAYDEATAFQYLEQAADQSSKEVTLTRYSHVKPHRFDKSKRRAKYIWVGSIVFLFVVFPNVFMGFDYFLMKTVDVFPIAFAVVGFYMFKSHSRRTDDSHRFCAACDYQQAPDIEQPEQCPECGNHWLEDGRFTLGTKIDSPWKFWLGLALLILGLLLIFAGEQIMTWTFTTTGIPLPSLTNPGSCECP